MFLALEFGYHAIIFHLFIYNSLLLIFDLLAHPVSLLLQLFNSFESTLPFLVFDLDHFRAISFVVEALLMKRLFMIALQYIAK